jgi:carbonic anhydrase/acetyltransferase-like protein (isoleucine patch superfamily)
LPLLPFNGKMPQIGKDVFIAEGAMVIGDVTIGDHSSVWFNAVIRGDVGRVVIGKYSNVQDNCCIHTDTNGETILGDYVLLGHGAVIHSGNIGDKTLIAMNATVLNFAEIGAGSIVGAGAVVAEGKKFPPNSVIMGVPGKVVRELPPEDAEIRRRNAEHYAELAKEYLKGGQS